MTTNRVRYAIIGNNLMKVTGNASSEDFDVVCVNESNDGWVFTPEAMDHYVYQDLKWVDPVDAREFAKKQGFDLKALGFG